MPSFHLLPTGAPCEHFHHADVAVGGMAADKLVFTSPAALAVIAVWGSLLACRDACIAPPPPPSPPSPQRPSAVEEIVEEPAAHLYEEPAAQRQGPPHVRVSLCAQ